MLSTIFKIVCCALTIVAFSDFALACPKIGPYPDVNCDGEFSILVIGDSLTVGARERDRHTTKSSWPKLLRALIEKDIPGRVRIETLAKTRITCHQLVRRLSSKLRTEDAKYDLVIPFCGVNDLLKGSKVAELRKTMKLMTKILKRKRLLVYWAKLTPTFRKEIKKAVAKVNQQLRFPAIPFDRIAKRSLGRDLLHLNKYGYKRLASIAYRYIKQVYVRRAERQLGLRDLDGNGIYDRFELVTEQSDQIADGLDGELNFEAK